MDTYLIGRGQVFPRSCVNKLCFFSSVASFSTKVQIRMKLVPYKSSQILSLELDPVSESENYYPCFVSFC